MRVTFLTEFYPTTVDADVRGGVELHIFRLSQTLASYMQVEVLARFESTTKRQQQVGGVTVRRIGPPTNYTQGGSIVARLQFAWQARRYILAHIPDVIVAGNFVGYLIASLLPRRLHQQTALIYHDVWIGEWMRHVGFLSGIFGEIAERLTRRQQWGMILPNSRVTSNELVAKRFHAKYVELVPCGTDVTECREIVPRNFVKPTVVVVARLVRYKHVHDVIEAVARIRHTQPVRLYIVGSGPEQVNLEALAQQLSLGDDIVFVGHLARHTDVLSYIKGADIFSLPSAVEGFGIVTIEAMACGTPYVNSDIPPTREVTNNGTGGVLFPTGNVDRLASALSHLLLDREERKRLGAAGMQHAAAYDYAHISIRLAELLAQLSLDTRKQIAA